MPNITISIEEDLLDSARNYAQEHGTSLNALIRLILERTVTCSKENPLKEMFELMDRAGGDSGGVKWTRDELYRV